MRIEMVSERGLDALRHRALLSSNNVLFKYLRDNK